MRRFADGHPSFRKNAKHFIQRIKKRASGCCGAVGAENTDGNMREDIWVVLFCMEVKAALENGSDCFGVMLVCTWLMVVPSCHRPFQSSVKFHLESPASRVFAVADFSPLLQLVPVIALANLVGLWGWVGLVGVTTSPAHRPLVAWTLQAIASARPPHLRQY